MAGISRHFALGFALSVFAASAGADPYSAFDYSASAGYWDFDTDGRFEDNNTVAFDPNSDISLEDGDDAFYELSLRSTGKFLPTVVFRYINLQVDGSAVAQPAAPAVGGLGGIIGVPGITTTQTFDLSANVDDYELISYYEFGLPAGFGVELGGSVKFLDGEAVSRNRETGQTERRDIRATFPLLVGGLSYRATDWLGARFTARGISAGGDSASELRASIDVRALSWLSASAGWWRKDFDIEDRGDTNADISLSGPYLSLTMGL